MKKALSINKKAFKKILDEMTDEEKEKYFPPDTKPKGWVDIEEHLPMVTGQDLIDNNALVKIVKVRNIDGRVYKTQVGDHHVWYYYAKDTGITHWLND